MHIEYLIKNSFLFNTILYYTVSIHYYLEQSLIYIQGIKRNHNKKLNNFN